MKESRLLSFHKNNYLDPAGKMAETLALELTGPFWSNERGDLEVTCSTLKTAKEPLDVFRLSRRLFCRGGQFFVRRRRQLLGVRRPGGALAYRSLPRTIKVEC